MSRRNFQPRNAATTIPQFRLSQFQFLKKLGEGKFGVVLEVLDSEKPGERFAIKLVNGSDNESAREVVNLEATINDPCSNVVQFQGICYENSSTIKGEWKKRIGELLGTKRWQHITVIKFELCTGTLDAIIIERNLNYFGNPNYDYGGRDDLYGPIELVDLNVSCLKDVCSGIDHIHNRLEMVHRDIKPANILYVKSGGRTIWKIADLGVSKRPDKSMTPGRGTYLYCPREQQTSNYGKEVDIYSFGLVMFDIIYPIHDERSHESYFDALTKAPHSLPADARKFDQKFPGWQSLVKRMVNIKPGINISDVSNRLESMHRNIPKQSERTMRSLNGSYSTVQYIGKGYFGTVAKVVDTSGSPKIVKIIEYGTVRLRSQYRRAIDHENICKNYAAWNEVTHKIDYRWRGVLEEKYNDKKFPERLFLLEKECCAFNLQECLAERNDAYFGRNELDRDLKFTGCDLRSCVKDMANGLKHLHSIKIWHGNLKPRNILYDEVSKKWKLTDFNNVRKPYIPSNIPIIPMMLDSFYHAPEQSSDYCNANCDIYSFGLIMFEICYMIESFEAHQKLLFDLKEHGRLPKISFRDIDGANWDKLITESVVKIPPRIGLNNVIKHLTSKLEPGNGTQTSRPRSRSSFGVDFNMNVKKY